MVGFINFPYLSNYKPDILLNEDKKNSIFLVTALASAIFSVASLGFGSPFCSTKREAIRPCDIISCGISTALTLTMIFLIYKNSRPPSESEEKDPIQALLKPLSNYFLPQKKA